MQQHQGLLDFPLAVLARVLEHVPQQQRLSQCPLVCQHFAAAAALAKSSIGFCNRRRCFRSSYEQRHHLSDSKLPVLQPWIEQHAGQLVSIGFCGDHLLQLPCADLLQLTSLELAGQMLLLQDAVSTSTHAAGGAGAAGMSLRSGRKKTAAAATPTRQRAARAVGQHSSAPMQQLLPKLQRLELSECKLRSVQPLLQLSWLASLTSLELTSLTLAGPAGQPSSAQQPQEQQDALSTAICTLLPHLKRLGHLNLGAELAGAGLARVTQELTRLPQLRSFGVSIPSAAAPTDNLLADLPPGLTKLVMWDMRQGCGDRSEVPAPPSLHRQLPQLSDLQELEISSSAWHPSLLRDTPQLRRLEVNSCKVLPGGSIFTDEAAARAAAAACLAAVGTLKHLTQLHIRCDISYCFAHENLNAGNPAAYTALTASSTLHGLTYSGVDHLPLPWGAMEHAFPQGKALPFLTHLCIGANSSVSEGVTGQGEAEHEFGFMAADSLPAVFAACPSLVFLGIRNALQPGDLTPLLQLPATVQSIEVGGEAWDDAAAGVVGQLTQLRSVDWEASDGLTDAGLQHLTALQELTSLCMFAMPGLSGELLDDGVHYTQVEGLGSLTLRITDMSDKPVWQQLCDRLDKSPVSAAQRLEQHKRDKQQLQEQVVQLQQRVTDLEQQNAELQQLPQQVTQLQQQVAALEQQNAELRQRLCEWRA